MASSRGKKSFESTLRGEISNCASEGSKLIILAYSQGALSVHLALQDLEIFEPGLLKSIAGVAMLSDPARDVGSWVPLYDGIEGGLLRASSSVGMALSYGAWWAARGGSGGAGAGDLPSSLTSNVVAMCHQGDPVCALDTWDSLVRIVSGLDFSQHTNYSEAEILEMGEALVVEAMRQ
ncbi:MAG: cutinase family protein [Actinomycetales bacterium]|nr:cutinase family protein [Actinomycetales bacterium]